MTFGLCLHGAAVARQSMRLHQTDFHAITMARAAGAQIVAIEAVASRGSAPTAINEALAAGAVRGLRLVDPALETADAQTTGFAFATVLDRLSVDLILFGNDADPEGVHDVPACIADHMSAHYFDGVIDLQPVPPEGDDPSVATALEISCAAGAWTCRLRVPLDAVMGIAGGAAAADAGIAGDPTVPPRPATAAAQGTVEILTLADLKVDSTLLRRRNDPRGEIVASPRPLVTLHSHGAAIAIAALLRR